MDCSSSTSSLTPARRSKRQPSNLARHVYVPREVAVRPPRSEEAPAALSLVGPGLCTSCYRAFAIIKARCQICLEVKAKRVIYGPYEKRQYSSVALKGKNVKSRLSPSLFKKVPGGDRRNPFEPTIVEVPPLGKIEVPLDPGSLTFGLVPYVEHWWSKAVGPALDGANKCRQAGNRMFDFIQVGSANDKAELELAIRSNRPAVLLPKFREELTSMSDAIEASGHDHFPGPNPTGWYMHDLSTAQNANRETIGRPKDAVLQDVRQHYRSDPKNEKLSTEFGNILSIQIPYDADLPDIFQTVQHHKAASAFYDRLTQSKSAKGTSPDEDRARKVEVAKFHNWRLEASAGAFTPWHIDAAGSLTWVQVKSGMKIWLFRDDPASDAMDVDSEGRRALEDGTGEAALLDAVFLHEGMTLVMPPGQSHAVYTVCPTLCHGGHFFSLHAMAATAKQRLEEHKSELVSNETIGPAYSMLTSLAALLCKAPGMTGLDEAGRAEAAHHLHCMLKQDGRGKYRTKAVGAPLQDLKKDEEMAQACYRQIEAQLEAMTVM